MMISVKCLNGHRVRVAVPVQGKVPRCPRCDALVRLPAAHKGSANAPARRLRKGSLGIAVGAVALLGVGLGGYWLRGETDRRSTALSPVAVAPTPSPTPGLPARNAPPSGGSPLRRVAWPSNRSPWFQS